MPEQILRIEPDHELKFKGPFNVPSTTLLKITNPSDKRVCFKIKTTAPKRYCVRPNAGLLQPGTSANIAVVFQPCELEPTANKHKFMVQALYAPDGDASIDMDSLWKDVDNTKLMDTKLRCTFENGADSGNQNDLNASDDGKATRGKHEDTFAASKSHKDAPVADELMATFVLADDSSALRTDMNADENHGGDVANRLSVQPETIQLRQENGQLKEEIDRLKRQLKSREASGFSGMAMQNASPPAAPMLQIILALVVLLVGLWLVHLTHMHTICHKLQLIPHHLFNDWTTFGSGMISLDNLMGPGPSNVWSRFLSSSVRNASFATAGAAFVNGILNEQVQTFHVNCGGHVGNHIMRDLLRFILGGDIKKIMLTRGWGVVTVTKTTQPLIPFDNIYPPQALKTSLKRLIATLSEGTMAYESGTLWCRDPRCTRYPVMTASAVVQWSSRNPSAKPEKQVYLCFQQLAVSYPLCCMPAPEYAKVVNIRRIPMHIAGLLIILYNFAIDAFITTVVCMTIFPQSFRDD